MAKPAPVPTPDASPLDMLRDALLFAGDFKMLFYITLIGFSMVNSRVVLASKPKDKKKINFFHGAALMVLMNYGGSTIAAVMCGKPVAFCCNEALVPVALGTYAAMYFAGDSLNAIFKDTAAGAVVTSLCYEIMRCHVLMNCTAMAQKTLAPQLAVPSDDRVAIIAPLIAGILGGCGGAFMPVNKGLEPLENGTNWRIVSAMICSAWLFLSMQYPDSKAAIGFDAQWARATAVAFCAFCPLVTMATGIAPFGANPLVAGPAAGKVKKN